MIVGLARSGNPLRSPKSDSLLGHRVHFAGGGGFVILDCIPRGIRQLAVLSEQRDAVRLRWVSCLRGCLHFMGGNDYCDIFK